LKKRFDFDSFEQAQAFVQRVGVKCSTLDHHPEWSITNGGKSINVKLTSHFAGNKLSLLDFQLAEIMNVENKIVMKTFKKFPLLESKVKSSWSIFFMSFVAGSLFLSFVTSFGVLYPSAEQRGEKPQAAHIRPRLVAPFSIAAGQMRTDEDASLYAETALDDYYFKDSMFLQKRIY
jgi:pterin-4a-carbinolamine dehydratase